MDDMMKAAIVSMMIEEVMVAIRQRNIDKDRLAYALVHTDSPDHRDAMTLMVNLRIQSKAMNGESGPANDEEPPDEDGEEEQ